MKTIASYEFLLQDGEYVLMTGRLAEHPSSEPAFLVSAVENKGYLLRGPGEVYEFAGIEPEVIVRLHRQEYVIIIEMEGERPAYSYDAPAGPLEYDINAWAVTKTLIVAWHRFARYLSGVRSQA